MISMYSEYLPNKMKICFPEVYNCNQFVIIINTVEPVLRGHLWNTKCDLLIQVTA